jgi:hypothetical protein
LLFIGKLPADKTGHLFSLSHSCILASGGAILTETFLYPEGLRLEFFLAHFTGTNRHYFDFLMLA